MQTLQQKVAEAVDEGDFAYALTVIGDEAWSVRSKKADVRPAMEQAQAVVNAWKQAMTETHDDD